MGSFNRDYKGSGRGGNRNFGKKGRNFFGGSGFDNHGGGKKAFMHDAVCAKCGKDCQVPFKPSGDRPIFCSNCFDKSGNDQVRFSKDNFSRPHFEDKQMFAATCVKCGDKCQVPFKPSSGKPVFCSNCFEKKNISSDNGFDQFKDQLASLNAKLDLILKSLNSASSVEVPLVETPVKVKKKIKDVVTKEKTSKKISTKKKK